MLHAFYCVQPNDCQLNSYNILYEVRLVKVSINCTNIAGVDFGLIKQAQEKRLDSIVEYADENKDNCKALRNRLGEKKL